MMVCRTSGRGNQNLLMKENNETLQTLQEVIFKILFSSSLLRQCSVSQQNMQFAVVAQSQLRFSYHLVVSEIKKGDEKLTFEFEVALTNYIKINSFTDVMNKKWYVTFGKMRISIFFCSFFFF